MVPIVTPIDTVVWAVPVAAVLLPDGEQIPVEPQGKGRSEG